MNRKIVALNLALLALAGVLGWRIRVAWTEARERERATLTKTEAPPQLLPPPAVPDVQPATPADYIDVAQRTLFTPDRNPNVLVVVEEPPPPPPPPPMPELPRYHGQMALGEPVIILSYEGIQKSYQAGEKIGEFTVTSWDNERLTLDWKGEEVVRPLQSLRVPEEERVARAPRDKSAAPPRAVAAKPAAARNQTSARANQGEIGQAGKEGEPILGRQVGAFRTCEAGDTSPAGTVAEGFRKVVSQTLMGPDCHWEPVQ